MLLNKNFVIPNFLFFGLLISGISELVAGFFFFLSGLIWLIHKISSKQFYFISFFISALMLFRFLNYFYLNTPELSVQYFSNEGRILLAGLLLCLVSDIVLNKEYFLKTVYYLQFQSVIWLIFAFIDVAFNFGIFDISHHQRGITALSCLFINLLAFNKITLVNIFVLLLNVLVIFNAGSRTSLLAALLFIVFILTKISFKKFLTLSFVGILFIHSIQGMNFNIGNRIYSVPTYTQVKNAWLWGLDNWQLFLNANEAASSDVPGAGDLEGNIRGRILVYAKAYQLIQENFIFGIGLGRFNDNDNCEKKRFGYCALWERKDLKNNNSSTHNTYLHILVEEGIFIFIILIFCISWILKKISNMANFHGDIKEILIVKSIFIIFLASGILHHTLVSPNYIIGMLLPFFIIFNSRLREMHKL